MKKRYLVTVDVSLYAHIGVWADSEEQVKAFFDDQSLEDLEELLTDNVEIGIYINQDDGCTGYEDAERLEIESDIIVCGDKHDFEDMPNEDDFDGLVKLGLLAEPVDADNIQSGSTKRLFEKHGQKKLV